MPQRQQMLSNKPMSQALNNTTIDQVKAWKMIAKHYAFMLDKQMDMLKAPDQNLQVFTEQQKAQYRALMAKNMAQMQQGQQQ